LAEWLCGHFSQEKIFIRGHSWGGRFDFLNCFAVTERYYQELQAPTKELIWLENSAHIPHYSEADRCQQILIDRFTPLRQ